MATAVALTGLVGNGSVPPGSAPPSAAAVAGSPLEELEAQMATVGAAFTESRYTAGSWLGLSGALSAAQTLLDDSAPATLDPLAISAASQAVADAAAALVSLSGSPPVTIELNGNLTSAERLSSADYTPASWAALPAAVARAALVLTATLAAQADVDSAGQVLTGAVGGLIRLADLTALANAITEVEAEGLDPADYTPSSWAAFAAALATAKAEAEAPTSQTAIVQAKTNLTAARAGLRAPDPSPPSSTPPPSTPPSSTPPPSTPPSSTPPLSSPPPSPAPPTGASPAPTPGGAPTDPPAPPEADPPAEYVAPSQPGDSGGGDSPGAPAAPPVVKLTVKAAQTTVVLAKGKTTLTVTAGKKTRTLTLAVT
jgi:hypothetical protein